MKPNITKRIRGSINNIKIILDMDILLEFLERDEKEKLQFCLDTLEEVKEIFE